MKFKCEMIYQKVGNTYLAVPVGEGAQGLPNYIELNGTCLFIAERISRGCDIDAIISGFASHFGAPEDIARRDVESVVAGFRGMGVLE